MVEINAYANGKEVPYETIKQWEVKRLASATSFVHRLMGIKEQHGAKAMEEQRHSLAELKIKMGEDMVREKLGFRLGLSLFVMKIAAFFSFGRRKYSVVEIAISGVGIKATAFLEKLNYIMLNEDVEYNKMRLMACPDHYLIVNTGENTQEVIETTGGSPFPTQFYICYGDDEGLRSQMDPTYDEQLFGVARAKNGTVIGGVRHQIRNESNGLRLKLLVEFPALIFDWMIRQHQAHLICEFGNWIKDVLAMPSTSQ
ncbi:hypothetical protein BGX27_004878 [Mortierella sp. AM989]|nr:hypothetical protein BGX27_004878 [Mortierella sp. AM989]